MKLAGIRCSLCDADELISIQPGQDAVYAPGGFMLHPGTRDIGYCRRCLARSFSAVSPLFAEMAHDG